MRQHRAPPKTFGVGEKASLGNLDMTVNGVRVSDGRDTSGWVPFPKQGSIYLLINVDSLVKTRFEEVPAIQHI